MRIILTIVLTILAGCARAQVPPPEALQNTFTNNNPNSYTKISAGPDILSIGETAQSYFEGIVDLAEQHPSPDDPFHPKNYLRDRDGLSPAEIAEVIAVANNSKAKAAPVAPNDAIGGCQALNAAKTSDAQLAVLEAGEVAFYAKRKQEGDALLALLSPQTRAHLNKVLVEYRKSITVGRQDWRRVRNENPEALEMYRAATCNNVVQK